jgi:AraC-like DNA-binding protein
LATTYLARSEAPISEIAFLLDYADQATFTTAFKRWTGTTPRAFRNAA